MARQAWVERRISQNAPGEWQGLLLGRGLLVFFLFFILQAPDSLTANCKQSTADWGSTGGNETLTSHYLVGCLILIGCARAMFFFFLRQLTPCQMQFAFKCTYTDTFWMISLKTKAEIGNYLFSLLTFVVFSSNFFSNLK